MTKFRIVMAMLLTATLLSLTMTPVGAQTVERASASVVRAINGTAAQPSITFASNPALGFYKKGANQMSFTDTSDSIIFDGSGSGGITLFNSYTLAWGSSGVNSPDTNISRPAAGQLLLTGTGTNVPMEIRTKQTTAPTCTTSCGTSPAVSGTDTAGQVTMGATGTPASGWVVTFNGTWGAAPVCNVWSNKAGMVVGKMPIVVVTTTTTFTVTTNGTAPSNADSYGYHCFAGA